MKEPDLQTSAETLAARMASGEEDAYVQFADEFGPRIRACFIHFGLRGFDAEDLAVSCITDICRKVIQGKYKSEVGGSFSAWVNRVAINYLHTHWRKKQRENLETVPIIESIHVLEHNAVIDCLREKKQGCREIEQLSGSRVKTVVSEVRKAVASLSPVDQEILALRELGPQLPHSEIGVVLNMKPGTVKVRHHRLLKKLESKLKKLASMLPACTRNSAERKEVISTPAARKDGRASLESSVSSPPPN